MAGLADLLGRFPDNDVGAIDADDLRVAITELWAYTTEVQRQLNEVVVDGVNVAQERITDLETHQPYVGQVASDGTLVGGPPGWSSSYDPETRLYTVAHTLGTEAFAVVVTPLTKTDAGQVAMVAETSATSFTYGVWHSGTGELHGTYANFVVGVL